MKLKQFLPALAAGSALISGGALAADDGLLGVGAAGTASSQGEAQVRLIVPHLVQISNMNDFYDLDNTNGYSLTDGVCIYSNSGAYDIQANSTNTSAAGTFQVTDGSNYVGYTVAVDDGSGTLNTSLVESGTVSTGLPAPSQTSVNCGGGTNVDLTVTAVSTEVQAAPPGTYNDTLTLLVTAQ
jgi:hypothetical protein